MRPTVAIIDLDAISHNVRELRRITSPAAELMAVVKADAYGHGIVETAAECLAAGATRLGVAVIDEAVSLRRAGFDCPILAIGHVPGYSAATVLDFDITATVFSMDDAEAISEEAGRRGRRARVHIKVDTGMSRLGVWPDEAGALSVERVVRLPGLEAEGIFTHFADADEADKGFARGQFARFMDFLDRLRARGVEFRLRHAANSAALLDLPETHLDMVRPGVLIGGLWPSDAVSRPIDLRPAMTVRTRVALVRDVPAGRAVSYGRTYTTSGTVTLATVPLGYHDGYRRGLSNRAFMLVHGSRAPVRGRVCMDQTIIDVSGLDVRAGDEVIALGRQGTELVSAEELASLTGTIGYEVVATVGRRVARLYVRQGRPVRLASIAGRWDVTGWQDLPWLGVESGTSVEAERRVRNAAR
ncbi:MAG: alanine racemase [Bacillota bacterium]|nr:alanine racemase [Bacillota bacterium]